jgi:hypothetical protein
VGTDDREVRDPRNGAEVSGDLLLELGHEGVALGEVVVCALQGTPNNLAERALRHWVIARRISYGTRTPQGSRAFTVLASVIETCRQRSQLPWPYIAEALRLRRQGNAVPVLPPAVA